MSGFSGVLQLTDLDDFIAPSQECIKPISTPAPVPKTSTGAKIVIGDDDGLANIDELPTPSINKLQKVEISLTDCLACSGCITSAESVLISQQSEEELMKVFEENKTLNNSGRFSESKVIVVSISVQPILSLATFYNLTPNECASKLSGYLKSLGADLVLDMSIADDLALLENQKEFVRRFRNCSNDGEKNIIPMLASSCPGWVCYAEKTHGSFILPHIATTKSPQQIMGSLVKNWLQVKYGSRKIYHVTIMPCYDKKLEASRADFFNNDINSKDVDCVMTSIELQQMMIKQGVLLENADSSTFSQPWTDTEVEVEPNITSRKGTGSGGYSDHILKYAAQELFGFQCDNFKYNILRNSDFREAILEVEGKPVLKFAIANGFRNLQNLVQKIKRGKCQYHYVEVMACPSGCLNGGAQIKPKTGDSAKQLSMELEELYRKLPVDAPEDNKVVKDLYQNWLGGVESDKSLSMLHTKYHAFEKTNVSLNIKW